MPAVLNLCSRLHLQPTTSNHIPRDLPPRRHIRPRNLLLPTCPPSPLNIDSAQALHVQLLHMHVSAAGPRLKLVMQLCCAPINRTQLSPISLPQSDSGWSSARIPSRSMPFVWIVAATFRRFSRTRRTFSVMAMSICPVRVLYHDCCWFSNRNLDVFD
jgi:hypothetical protein